MNQRCFQCNCEVDREGGNKMGISARLVFCDSCYDNHPAFRGEIDWTDPEIQRRIFANLKMGEKR